MNRVWGMLKWVREKMNIKLALLVLVMGTGMFTAWQVYSRISKPKQLPEPKKITTGGNTESDLATQASAESPVADPNGPPPTQPQFAFNPNAFGPHLISQSSRGIRPHTARRLSAVHQHLTIRQRRHKTARRKSSLAMLRPIQFAAVALPWVIKPSKPLPNRAQLRQLTNHHLKICNRW
jgi:hypothetical protein